MSVGVEVPIARGSTRLIKVGNKVTRFVVGVRAADALLDDVETLESLSVVKLPD